MARWFGHRTCKYAAAVTTARMKLKVIVDSPNATLPPEQDEIDAPRGPSISQVRWSIFFALALGGILFATFYQVDQFTVHPGSADAVVDRVEVVGSETFASEGEILFLTVQIDDDVNVWEWTQAKVDDSIDFRDPETVLGDRTEDESRSFNLELMQTSKSNAVLVSLSRLGYDVVDEVGAGVSAVEPSTAADGFLEPGDVIIAIDGETTLTSEALVAELRSFNPGDTAELTVIHPDRGERVEIVELGARPDGEAGAFLGISVQTAIDEAELPIDVNVDTGKIGGNSAGLALTLTIMDALTEGDLTGGKRVAVTGTIQLNGDVGNVGGVKQKAVTSNRAGVDLMIVPIALLATAELHAGDVPVVGVATLDEALAALAEIGGNVDALDQDLAS